MSGTIDFNQMPSTPGQWRYFIQALADAGNDLPESGALELKGQVDVTSTEFVAKAARFILGCANRDPGDASRTYGGYAFLIAGVGDGEVFGVAPVEDLLLRQQVEKYVIPRNGGGPVWDATWVRLEDKYVLVLEVAPPSAGDPLHPVLKDGPNNLNAGDVLIRRGSQTTKARAEDIAMLSRRAAAQPTVVDVSVEITSVPQVSFAFDDWEIHVERIADRLRESTQKRSYSTWDSILAVPSQSREEYSREVDAWEQRNQGRARFLVLEALAHQKELEVTVTNNRDTELNDIELSLTFRGQPVAVEQQGGTYDPFQSDPPPEPWEESPQSALLRLNGSALAQSLTYSLWQTDTRIVANGSDVKVDLAAFSLRPHQSKTIETGVVVAYVHTDVDTAPDTFEWELTASRVPGLHSGTSSLIVQHSQISLIDASSHR